MGFGFGSHVSARRSFHAGRSFVAPPDLRAALLSQPAALAAWDVLDRSSMSQVGGATIAVTADGEPVGRMVDLKGSLDFVAPGTDQRPLSPASFDGIADEWRLEFGPQGGIASGDFVCIYRGTDTRGMLLPSHASNPYAGVWDVGSVGTAIGNAGAADLLVDGVSFYDATRGQFATAIADGMAHVIEVRGCRFDLFEAIRLGNYPSAGFPIAGVLAPVAYLDSAAADIAAARDAARAFAQDRAARLAG